MALFVLVYEALQLHGKSLAIGAVLLLGVLFMPAVFLLLQQGKTSSGFHRTLKAVCVRKGVYVSRVFNRIDINNCLAEPIYAEIGAMFANIFR